MSAKPDPGPTRVLPVIITILVACFSMYLFFLSRDEKVVQFHAAVGDSMGALSAVFNSVAVAFAVWSVWLQRDELKVTRQELEHLQSDSKRTARLHQLNTRVELLRKEQEEVARAAGYEEETARAVNQLLTASDAMNFHENFARSAQQSALFQPIPPRPSLVSKEFSDVAVQSEECLRRLAGAVARSASARVAAEEFAIKPVTTRMKELQIQLHNIVVAEAERLKLKEDKIARELESLAKE